MRERRRGGKERRRGGGGRITAINDRSGRFSRSVQSVMMRGGMEEEGKRKRSRRGSGRMAMQMARARGRRGGCGAGCMVGALVVRRRRNYYGYGRPQHPRARDQQEQQDRKAAPPILPARSAWPAERANGARGSRRWSGAVKPRCRSDRRRSLDAALGTADGRAAFDGLP